MEKPILKESNTYDNECKYLAHKCLNSKLKSEEQTIQFIQDNTYFTIRYFNKT